MYKIILNNLLAIIIISGISACGENETSDKIDTRNKDTIIITEPDSVTLEFPQIKIDILPAGEIRTYQVPRMDLDFQVVYRLINNPSWMSINPDGLITFNAPSDSNESYSFQVLANYKDKNYTSNKISGSVRKINEALEEELLTAEERQVEIINAGVKTVRSDITFKVPNLNGTWDVLHVYAQKYGVNNEFIILDADGSIQKISKATSNWHIIESVITPNGKLYLASKGSQGLNVELNIYDPVTNILRFNVMSFPSTFAGSEVAPMTVGTDGKVYIASAYYTSDNGDVNNGKLSFVEIDTTNETFIYSGPIGDVYPNNQGAWKIAADDISTYVLGGKIPWTIVEYNRATKVSKTHAFSSLSMNITQTQFGVFANVNGDQVLADGTYWLYNGNISISADGKFGTPPWPIDPGINVFDTLNSPKDIVEANLPTKPEIILQNSEVDNEGNAEIWVKQPNVSTYKQYKYSVAIYPLRISRILGLDNGKIFGSVDSYGGYFMYDPSTGLSEFLGKTTLATYTIQEFDNKIYMSGYPSGTLYEYDMSKLWTHSKALWTPGSEEVLYNNQSLNPRWAGKLGDVSGAHKMYASALGIDGNLYFGGRWYRDGNGGGLSWHNPITNTNEGISDIFSNYQIRYMTSASEGKYIVISTYPVTDVTLYKPKGTSGRLFIFNTLTHEIEDSKTVDPIFDGYGSGIIEGVDGPYIVGITYMTQPQRTAYLYRLNIESGLFDYKIKINAAPSFTIGGEQNDGLSFKKGPKGKLWTFLNAKLVKIDPISGDIKVIAKFKKNDYYWGISGDIAFSGNDIYIANFKNLLRLPNVLNE